MHSLLFSKMQSSFGTAPLVTGLEEWWRMEVGVGSGGEGGGEAKAQTTMYQKFLC